MDLVTSTIEYVTEVNGVEVSRETGTVYVCNTPSDLAALFDLVMFGEPATHNA